MATSPPITDDDPKKLVRIFETISGDEILQHSPAVYVYENSNTGKFYVGATSNQFKRKSTHLRQLKAKTHVNHKLQEAYDQDQNFAFKPLLVKDVETAFILEKVLLKEFKTNPNSLNLAGSASVTSESRRKQSEAHLRRYQENPELIKQKSIQTASVNNPFYGKKHTEENNERQSEFQKNQWDKPEYRDNQVTLAKERWKSSEFRTRQIEAHTEGWKSTERRAIVSEKAKQRMSDPKVIINLSEKQTLRMKNPEAVDLSRQGAIKQWQDPKMRAKLCKAITINGINYESAVVASRELGICYNTIRSRVNSKFNSEYSFNN